jgi:hypothetical protein
MKLSLIISRYADIDFIYIHCFRRRYICRMLVLRIFFRYCKCKPDTFDADDGHLLTFHTHLASLSWRKLSSGHQNGSEKGKFKFKLKLQLKDQETYTS